MRKICGFIITIFLGIILLVGCSSKSEESSSPTSEKVIYEERLSPNESYVTSKDDVVYYNIKLTQDENHSITVTAQSNSAFFDKQQYTLEYDKEISEDNVKVHWTTLMGNPKASKEDQYAIVQITISHDGEILSERKINFAKNAMEIVGETLKRK